MTHKIYETDSYCKSFDATVLSCEQNAEHFEVILDKTAFFAEGGGQAADTGKIGDVEVLDVTAGRTEAGYSWLLYSSTISSTLVSRGLPGRQASA